MNLGSIVEALEGSTRFEQRVDPKKTRLEDDLVTPVSSRVIKHALVTTEILEDAVAPNFRSYIYDAYSPTTSYNTGEIIEESGVKYVSLVDGNINNLVSDPDFWKETDPYNQWLREFRKECVRETVEEVWRKKAKLTQVKDLIGKVLLYKGIGTSKDVIAKSGRFVGVEFNLSSNRGINVVLNQMMLQLTEAQVLPIYVFQSGLKDPVYQFDLNYTGESTHQWFDVDIIMQHINYSQNIDTGRYYLGYYEEDVVGFVVNKKVALGDQPCAHCSRSNHDYYTQYSKYIGVRGISVDSGYYVKGEGFDVDVIKEVFNSNLGMNFNINTYCDLTDTIIEHADLFSKAIAQTAILKALDYLQNSDRDNISKSKLSEKARMALMPRANGGGGMIEEWKEDIHKVGFEMSDLENSLCLPPVPSKGIIYTGIG